MQNSTVESFLNHLNLQMPQLTARQNFIDVEYHEDSSVLEFHIPEPLPIGELLDILDDHMELIILYHVIPTNATVMGEQCCAYSDPTCDFIYKVNGITDDNGKCDTVYVTLYQSLETLGIEVQTELEKKTASCHEVVFSRNLTEVLRDFIR